MARVWFSIVVRLEKEGRLAELKAELSGRTFVGEYAGNPEHQHMVRYPRETIVFYTIVENEAVADCIDPIAASRIFEKYGLDHVQCESKGICHSLGEVIKGIRDVYTTLATESLYNEEEGVVIYLVSRGAEKSFTLSLCKVKTLEYRIYRKIRENVKSQLRNSFG